MSGKRFLIQFISRRDFSNNKQNLKNLHVPKVHSFPRPRPSCAQLHVGIPLCGALSLCRGGHAYERTGNRDGISAFSRTCRKKVWIGFLVGDFIILNWFAYLFYSLSVLDGLAYFLLLLHLWHIGLRTERYPFSLRKEWLFF